MLSMDEHAQDLKQRSFCITGAIHSFSSIKGLGEEREPRLRTVKRIQACQGMGTVEELVIQSRAKKGPKRPSVPKGEPPGTN